MIRRFLIAVAMAHALYAAVWVLLSQDAEKRFERYAVTVAVTIAFLAYAVLVVAYLWARKSRLNTALAVNKAYWGVLIGALVLPVQWGLLIREAPYRTMGNPYSYWNPPAWARTYIWVFLTFSIIGVLWEFWLANWGKADDPPSQPDQLISARPSAAPPRADA